MQKAGEILGKALKGLKRSDAAFAWLAARWPSIVGKMLAAHTRPIRCESGRLEIAVDGKAWQKQLEAIEREFCARVNQAWGGNLVRQVKFITKPGPKRVPRELDNDHTPFVRRSRT
ncbi:MAG: DUF721 domain-containing protein [Candidatus Acidiferrales bacterium]